MKQGISMDLKEFKTESKGVKNNGEAGRNHNAKL